MLQEGRLVADEVCLRIDRLTTHHLREIKRIGGRWGALFQDPNDGRYWERTYPQSEMHGGGPPRLALLSLEEATKKYQL